MKKKYQEIHELVIDKEAEREWTQKPFNAGNETLSTDGVMLVATPKIGEFDDFTEKVGAVYPIIPTTKKTISVFELKGGMKSFPVIDVLDKQEIECDACKGYCCVDVEFYHNGKTFDIEVDCPVCYGNGYIMKGSGLPTGEKMLHPGKFVSIGGTLFKGFYIDKIIKIADILSADTIIVKRDDAGHGFFFCINDVNILLMPLEGHITEDAVFRVIPIDSGKL